VSLRTPYFTHSHSYTFTHPPLWPENHAFLSALAVYELNGEYIGYYGVEYHKI